MARTMLREPARSRVQEKSPPGVNGAAVVPLVPPRRKKPSWTLAGAVLVGLAALLSAWVFSTSSSNTRVMVAARDISPGEVVTATDLRAVDMGRVGEVRAVTSSQQALIIGHAARGPIPEGTVLNTDLFAEKDRAIPAGSVVVGAALEPGAAPTSRLAPGDRVDVLAVVKNTGTPNAPTATLLATGSVWSVERIGVGSTTSKLWVSVLVAADAQASVAQAAADGRLRLSLVGAPS